MKAPGKKDWFHYGIEFGIVVLGVTLAFILNNIAVQIGENRLERQYISDLKNEMNEDIGSLQSVIEAATNRMQRIETLMSRFGEDREIPLDSLTAVALELGTYHFFNPERFTYTVLSEAGDFSIIGDKEVKNRLIGLNTGYDRIEKEQNNYIQALDDIYFPVLMRNLDLVSREASNPEFFRSTLFRNLILFSYSSLKARITLYRQAREQAEELASML